MSPQAKRKKNFAAKAKIVFGKRRMLLKTKIKPVQPSSTFETGHRKLFKDGQLRVRRTSNSRLLLDPLH